MVKPGVVPWTPVWGILAPILLYFIGPVVAAIALGLYGSSQGWDANRISSWLTGSPYAQFFYMLIAQSIILVGFYLILRLYRKDFRILGLTRAKPIDAGYALIGYGVYFAAYLVLAGVLTVVVPGFDAQAEQAIGFEDISGLVPLAMVFISLVILPPLVEELMVRGFIFGSIRKYCGFIATAILTSILFGLAHLQGGNPGEGLLWIAAVDTFVLGMVLCYLREKTGRLWACIGLHALKNGVAFTLLFIVGVR